MIKACAATGIGTSTAYNFRYDDERFAEEWDKARKVGRVSLIDRVEDNALQRAADGVEEPVGWYMGAPGGTVTRHNEQLVLAMLRAHKPATYNIPQGDPGAR